LGQLGLGGNEVETFTLVSSLEGKKIAAVAAGGSHSLAIDAEGKVYATGWNEEGQLGLGDNEVETFTLVSSLEGKKIAAVAAGEMHSLALDTDGKLYATGWNDTGRLGLGDRKNRKAFTLVSSLEGKKIVAIAAGGGFSLAIDENGKIYAAGYDRGIKPKIDDKERRQGFAVWSFEGKKIVAVASSYPYLLPRFLAIDENGKVYAAGWNDAGLLGLGDNADRAVFTLVPLPNR
jgi:alpha-tubulin suppressor-like RCC1 family protein